ncbi:hypothetical protein K469DRAFT_611800 [Zopfia rhizophila CBS 207.26]|uniref:Uncharacterized protein n=1 Tax=Zopfia rhizophila CBS 207.26 TaxID=1314779 RepID=A0A6A6D6X8_9PEZI|nr:hypothetical protein K469DRAFT_611800 [Zopfia rhizophila CBS 207.26]
MLDSHLSSSRFRFAGNQNPSDTTSPSAVPSSPGEDTIEAGPGGTVHAGPAPLNRCLSLLEATVPQPFPLPSTSAPSPPTPLQETQPDLSLNFVGGALPSTDVSLPTPPIVKAGHNLRLPSFDLLGIAAPHPDRIALRSNNSFSSLGAGPLSKPEDPLHALSPPLSRPHQFGEVGEPSVESPEASKAEIEHLVPIDTPPTEPGTLHWGSFVNVKTAGMGSPPSSDPGVSPSLNVMSDASSSAPTAAPNASTAPGLPGTSKIESCIEQVKEIITSNLESARTDAVVKVLSHALPCPSQVGHFFPRIVAAIHDHTSTPTSWINVFHAVPGRFNLADLPKSPPSTPGPAVGGDEYFTSKVFDTAVAVCDYQWDSKLLPPFPRPVVAPGSVDVSIVERYIPPTNVNEFAEMFSLRGRSLLVDRLIELSPNNGTLVFIYLTRTGARTFMHDYLGPILDPLLRSMAVVHNLTSDLGTSLGSMASVNRLFEYDCLNAAMEKFCCQLSEGKSNIEKAGHKQAKYSLVHASKEEIILDRAAWASDWWIKQEKPRVRTTVAKCYRAARKLPADSTDSEITPANLIQEVLDGVASKLYEGPEPSKGVEIGVFVVRKSQ